MCVRMCVSVCVWGWCRVAAGLQIENRIFRATNVDLGRNRHAYACRLLNVIIIIVLCVAVVVAT